MIPKRCVSVSRFVLLLTICLCAAPVSAQRLSADRRHLKSYGIPKLNVRPHDWPQWGGTSIRNNTPQGNDIPIKWDVRTKHNIKWSVPLGTVTYASPVVANGKVFIGTNNGSGYLARFPSTIDISCLLCFDEQTGEFLWQHSNLKLQSGRVHDWPMQGIVAHPFVDGDRLWYVTNRGEVVCLDTEGFRDDENDGSFKTEAVVADNEADVIWKFDMMAKLGTRQHNMCTCSVTCAGDILFVVTGNGVDNGHINLQAPEAPSFLALDRNTAKVLWTDNSPGKNVLHGSWGSPTFAVLGGHPQVLFPGGDGWLYSFAPQGDGNGNSKLLWKFDCNLKESKWIMGGRGTRNAFISLPVIYDQKVYVAGGQDAEHSEGPGHLWCIDPTKKFDGSDVSPTLAYGADGKRIPLRRFQYVNSNAGESARPNPGSALVWHYDKFDLNGNGSIEFEEELHRSCGHVAIKDNLLFITDLSGLLHCVDAQTGKPHWTHDLYAQSWCGSPLIVDGKIYVSDDNGDIAIFKLSADKHVIVDELEMDQSIYCTPIVANNVLFIAEKHRLFAISKKRQ